VRGLRGWIDAWGGVGNPRTGCWGLALGVAKIEGAWFL
jgi:hypothetical protein